MKFTRHLNSHSQSNSGKAFLSLSPDQQVTLYVEPTKR